MTRHAELAALVRRGFDMRILVTGNPGTGKTAVIYDVLESLYKKSDWMDTIRYEDTFLSKGEESGVISHVTAETTLHDEFVAVAEGFAYNRDLIYAGLKSDSDYICEYPFGEEPEPEHAAFFDVILNVSPPKGWNTHRSIEVLKNRRGIAGVTINFEIKGIDSDGEVRIRYVEAD